MTRRLLSAAALAAIAALSSPTAAQEEVYLQVTSPGLKRVVIAVPDPPARIGVDPRGAGDFLSALRADLQSTAVVGLLEEERAKLVEVDPASPVLTRQRWRAVGAQFLLETGLTGAGAQLVADTRVWDLASGEVAYSRRLQGPATLAATMAHTLANEVVRLFTGRPGPFLSRIAFISDRSGAKEVWVMRWDGSEAQQITSHRSIALSPTWSSGGQWLAFTSFLRGAPQLFLLRPTEGYLKPISALPGVNSSPAFSPDGRLVAFASGPDGNTDIFVVARDGGTPTRLTAGRSIETQPAWSPSGRQIAFTSTASGNPQIWLMDAEGSNLRRLTFQAQFADEAAWSPDGVRVAFTTLIERKFQIGILDLRSGEQSVVAGPGNNESPCWSPDGTMLAFVSDRSGTKQIFLTDPVGVPRQITAAGNNAQPSWVTQLQ
ncbi:MAG: LpqB family beta-propeller domain-containing protein [Acidobacteriota bacterium]